VFRGVLQVEEFLHPFESAVIVIFMI